MDKDLLFYKMKRKNETIDSFCQKVGFSKSAFYRKINGKTQFTLAEIKSIIEVLDIDDPTEIFFVK